MAKNTCSRNHFTAASRALAWFVLLLTLVACGQIQHPPQEFPAATDLAVDADQARQSGAPVLLVVTRHDCQFCRRLKREVLRPMLLSGDYDGRVIMRELLIDPNYRLTDFSGNEIMSYELAGRYDAMFVPTVLLLDPRGQEAAQRLLGINTAEMYGVYLDRAIAEARERIHARLPGAGG